jgi:hypothetical protein
MKNILRKGAWMQRNFLASFASWREYFSSKWEEIDASLRRFWRLGGSNLRI